MVEALLEIGAGSSSPESAINQGISMFDKVVRRFTSLSPWEGPYPAQEHFQAINRASGRIEFCYTVFFFAASFGAAVNKQVLQRAAGLHPPLVDPEIVPEFVGRFEMMAQVAGRIPDPHEETVESIRKLLAAMGGSKRQKIVGGATGGGASAGGGGTPPPFLGGPPVRIPPRNYQ